MKKTGKKKAAKKKSGKKKVAAKKKRVTCTHTVRISSTLGVVPEELPVLQGEGVRWKNATRKKRKISFPQKWPFKGPKQSVTVGPGDTSKCFEVKRHPNKQKIKYVVVPAVPDNGGPDSPAVDYQG